MPDLNSSREGACFNALGSLFYARQALKTKSFLLAIFDDGVLTKRLIALNKKILYQQKAPT